MNAIDWKEQFEMAEAQAQGFQRQRDEAWRTITSLKLDVLELQRENVKLREENQALRQRRFAMTPLP